VGAIGPNIVNAILDGTDAVMLSAETSVGAFPIEAVQMMTRIALETEGSNHPAAQPGHRYPSLAHAVSHAARALAEDSNIQKIVVFTRSGNTAWLISKDRPRVPILAYTPSEHVYHQLALWWGVWPYPISMQGTTEDLIALVEQRLLDEKLAQQGDYVVMMGGMPIASRARTNFVKLHRVGSDR
jgi:pyruvate kinase